jgi:hypothetical protein
MGYIKSHPQVIELSQRLCRIAVFLPRRRRTIAGIIKFMKLSDRARAEEAYDYYYDLTPVIP